VLHFHSGKDGAISFEKSCDVCKQHYTNRKEWKAHLQSTRHALRVAEPSSECSLSTEISPSPNDLSPSPTSPAEGGEIDLDDEVEEDEEVAIFNPVQCLFCTIESTSLDSNLSHMSHAHNFLIPDTEHLIDLESFISYLFAVVAVFHECLFCGSLRDSKLGVQNHMRDKGHCKLKFEDDEHGIRVFYDFTDDEDDGEQYEEATAVVVHGEEMRLPSGKTLGHRSHTRHSHRNFHRQSSTASPNLEEPPVESDAELLPPESKDRSLSLRAGTSTSMIGVSQLQQRALMAVEKNILKVEMIAKKEYESRVERGANRQKRYKVASLGKKQGGLEKRNG
jgi:pre-60S factor REI1